MISEQPGGKNVLRLIQLSNLWRPPAQPELPAARERTSTSSRNNDLWLTLCTNIQAEINKSKVKLVCFPVRRTFKQALHKEKLIFKSQRMHITHLVHFLFFSFFFLLSLLMFLWMVVVTLFHFYSVTHSLTSKLSSNSDLIEDLTVV